MPMYCSPHQLTLKAVTGSVGRIAEMRTPPRRAG